LSRRLKHEKKEISAAVADLVDDKFRPDISGTAKLAVSAAMAGIIDISKPKSSDGRSSEAGSAVFCPSPSPPVTLL
jgi:hypothetical protein